MQIIAAVTNQTKIITAEFIKLSVLQDGSSTVYDTFTFSNAYKAETIGGQVYSPLGGLLSVGNQQRDIKATNADTSISLSGLGSDNIYIVLSRRVKGATVTITRGFYSSNYVLSSTSTRFTGIVTSFNINEDYTDNKDNFTVTLSCSNFKTILSNRIAGRKTNSSSWKEINPTDTSMDRVQSLSDQKFDFGKPIPIKPSANANLDSGAYAANGGGVDTTNNGSNSNDLGGGG